MNVTWADDALERHSPHGGNAVTGAERALFDELLQRVGQLDVERWRGWLGEGLDHGSVKIAGGIGFAQEQRGKIATSTVNGMRRL